MLDRPWISVVIPTYGAKGEALTATCIKSMIAMHTQVEPEVIVVEDGGEQEHTEVAGLGATIIKLPERSGFAKAVNAGIRRTNGEIVFLINNDIEFIEPALQVAGDALFTTNSGLVGIRLLYPDGRVQFGGTYFAPSKGENGIQGYFDHFGRFNNGLHPTVVTMRHRVLLTGAFLGIRRYVFNIVGLLDERFGFAAEDVDYCVSGETPVLTSNGWTTARELSGGNHNVLTIDGKFFPSRWFEARGGPQRLWKVGLSSGETIYATQEHRWPTIIWGRTKWVTTEQLLGKSLLRSYPALNFSGEEFRMGVQHGFCFGDGTRNTGRPSAKVVAYPSNLDKQLFVKEWFDDVSEYKNGNVVGNNISGCLKDLPDNKSRDYLAGFVAGYIASDGSVTNRSATLSSSKIESIDFVRDAMREFGLRGSSVYTRKIATPYSENSITHTLRFPLAMVRENLWMILRPDQRNQLSNTGTFTKRDAVIVVSVTPTDRVEPVYCCEEPITHTWATIGNVITGNCLQCLQAGLQTLYVGYPAAIHHEGATRGRTVEEKMAMEPEIAAKERKSLEFLYKKWVGFDWPTFGIDTFA